MAKETRPSLTYKWASSGDVATPTSGKISLGWVVEKPPVQWWNFLENRQDQALSYLYQQGIPEWDATIEYQSGSSFIQSGGKVYKSIQTGTNKTPASEPTYWTEFGAGIDLTATPFATLAPAQGLIIRPSTAAATGSVVISPQSTTADVSTLTLIDRYDFVNNVALAVQCSESGSYVSLTSNGSATTPNFQVIIDATPAVTISPTGDFGFGTASPTGKVDINDDVIRVRTAKTPSSATDTGNAGDICWDSSYVYVCVATDTWKRSAIATW